MFGRKKETQDDLCEIEKLPSTPVRPGQVVDGIKFIQERDPTYRHSDIFDSCSEIV